MSTQILLDELNRQREAAPPARDRLLTTTFLAAALHALVILGVTFTPPIPGASPDSASLQVLLVQNPVVEERANPTADYLAQVTQQGAGTGKDVRGAESPDRRHDDAGANGPDGSSDSTSSATPGVEGDTNVLASRAASRDKRFFTRIASAESGGAPPQADSPSPQAVGADSGDALRLRGPPKAELLVTANTRESSVAVYLDGWRRKIERIGTANYPMAAVHGAGLSGNPVLEVQILADGRLGAASVQRSSGHPELDQAALGILRLAAPFEPFPKALAGHHDALRLTYEWQFLGGEIRNSSIRMPSDTR